MRVEIDTSDLVKLVKQFTIKNIPDEDLLDDIEQLLTYPEEDLGFEFNIDIVEF
jgi:hypothetical protein